MGDYFEKDDGLKLSGEFFPTRQLLGKNNGNKSNYEQTEKYCIYYNVFVNGCKNETCPFFPCKFAEMHKKLVKMFQLEFKTTCDEARKVARTLLLNSYRPEKR